MRLLNHFHHTIFRFVLGALEGSEGQRELLHLRPVDTVGERVARDAVGAEAVEEVEGLGLDLVRAVLLKVGNATVDQVLVVLLAAALDRAVEVVLVQAADLVTDVNDTLDEALVNRVGAAGLAFWTGS